MSAGIDTPGARPVLRPVLRPILTLVLKLAFGLGLGLSVGLAGGVISPARAADDLLKPKGLVRGPLIRFDERVWDFGELPQQTQRDHTFRIRNEGTEALRLLRVEPDCGCLIAQPADSLIPPGAGTTLRVVLDTRDFEGEQRKVIIVETNDPAEPRIDLLLRCTVRAELDCSPRTLNYGKVRRGEQPVLSVKLVAEPGVPFDVKLPTQGTDYVVWKLARDPSLGPNAFRMDGTMRVDAPYGRFNQWVEIPVEHPKYNRMRISIRGFVHAYFVPDQVGFNFGTPVAGRETEKAIRIEADGSRPYRITSARTTNPLLRAVLTPDGTGYLLRVSMKPETSMTIKEKIILATTDPEQPTIELDVKGNVLPAAKARTK